MATVTVYLTLQVMAKDEETADAIADEVYEELLNAVDVFVDAAEEDEDYMKQVGDFDVRVTHAGDKPKEGNE